jgi:hypothetical protein
VSPPAREGASRKLVDHVAGPPELGPPRALLATTFDLTPEFFEVDFLPTLLRIPAWDDRRVRSRIQLEGELARMNAVAVMMEATRFQGRPRSLRVHVRPASQPRGVLHAKVTLLVHDEAVRLLVASANLTEAGYRHNREVAVALRADRKNPEAGALIRQALREMPTLLAAWWSDAAARAVADATSVLDSISAPVDAADDAFLWGGSTEPLWKKVLRFWPDDDVVRRIQVVSPFWSEEGAQGPLAQLVAGLRARSALALSADVVLVAAAQPESTTTFRPTLPASYGTFDARSLGIRAVAVAAKPQVDEEDVGRDDFQRERRLHAKVLLLEGAHTSVCCVGSANFTAPGFGFESPTHTVNVEACLVMRRRGKARAPLLALVPPTIGDPVTLNGAASGSIFVPEKDDDRVAFPHFLKAAELRPLADGASLELALAVDAAKTPREWSVALRLDAEPLLHLAGENAHRGEHHVALSPEALNELLRGQTLYVRWPDMPGSEAAPYPVNVALSAREQLPFGDPGSFPGESELVAFYQGRVAWEDVFPLPPTEEDGTGVAALESVVDTTRILSYQVRGFVEALHGIRDELRRSQVSGATIRLAFLGPISPVALAQQVHVAVKDAGRSSTAGAFQLVELLACLNDAAGWTVEPRVESVWKETCRESIDHVTRRLDDVRAGDGNLQLKTAFDAYARAVLPRADVRPVAK